MAEYVRQDHHLPHGSLEPHISNADRIRAMTDEELAELIPNLQDKDLDSLCPPKGSCYKDGGCKACWLEWLRKEAKDD